MSSLKLQYSLRSWQKEALSRWLENEMRGVVSVVTGGGKTVFAHSCIIEFLKATPNGRILIYVPTTALLDQWYVSLQEDLGVDQRQISSFSGDEKPNKPNIFNLMVINTARTIGPKLLTGFNSFLIVDECHRAGSPVNSCIRGEHSSTLGISATPIRDYDDGFIRYIVPKIGNIIYEYSYKDAYIDKVITPFELINIKVQLLSDEQVKFDSLNKIIAITFNKINNGNYDEKLKLKKLLQRRSAIVSSATMRIPVAAKIVEIEHGNQNSFIS